MNEMKRCECQVGFDVEIIAPDGTPITFPTRAEMQAALIAQYDAMVAAVPEWNAVVPLTSHAPDALRKAYADGWRDGWNAHRISTLNCIAQHDPRKGAE